MSNRNTYFFLIALMAFASVLRFYHLGNFGIFGDEKQGIMVAVGNVNIGGKKTFMSPDKTFTPKDFWRAKTIEELLDANARGDTSGNAVVHLISMNIFGKIFGHSDFSLRSVSVIFNLLTLLLIFFLTRSIFKSNSLALLAVFLATIDPFFIVYSQQARFYTTCIFFSTLSSYYFLKIMLENQTATKNYILYGISITLAIFSNYLTFTIFVCHGLYFLITDRTFKKFKALAVCYLCMAVPFVIWMTKGPGQYALLYIKDASNFYKSVLNNPKLANSYKGFIDFANWENLTKRGISIFSDYFIFTNGIYSFFSNKVAVIALITLFIIVILLIKKIANPLEKKVLLFCGLNIIIPFIFSLLSTYNAGVMTGFYFRYTAFGLPFILIFNAWVFIKSFQYSKFIGLGLTFIAIVQLYNYAHILKDFYRDLPQKYAAPNNRVRNPYITAAEKIKQIYAQGDTIVYPSKYENAFSKATKRNVNDFDNIDAQLVNLYLPKDAVFLQKIDIDEGNKIIIRKLNHTELIIFNFEGNKYRY